MGLPLILLFSLSAIIFYNQYAIMHPEHRELEAYHYDWLNHPENHSITIQKGSTDSDIPYLIVTHDEKVTPSKRTKILRDQLRVLGYTSESLQDNGILVMFHGKNGRKEDLLPVAERYATAGFTCILIDLPSHGENTHPLRYGQSFEEQHYAYTVLHTLQDKLHPHTKPIYFWGISLGGAFAISNTQIKTPYKPKALILLSTFDRLSSILQNKSVDLFGETLGKVLYKGLSLSLESFYAFSPKDTDSAKHASHIQLPVLIFHGEKDTLIPHQNGEKLYKAFASKKKRFILDKKADHKNILITDYPFYAESIDFLLKLP